MSPAGRYGYRYPEVSPDDLRRELYVTSVGHLLYSPGQSYPTAEHPGDFYFRWNQGRVLGDFVIVIIAQGGGRFEVPSGKFSCRAGDLLMIPPGVWHRYRPDAQTGWREKWICANGEYLHRLRAKRQCFNRAELIVGGATPALCAAQARLQESFVRRGEPNNLATAAAALEMFGLAVSPRPGDRAHLRAAAATGDDLVDAAREFIWFNSHRPLTVDFIAAQLGVSRRTLERRYAAGRGRTVIRELIDRRVQCARQLLAESAMSVKEISYAVGFGDSRRLIRNFARTLGITPEASRRKSR